MHSVALLPLRHLDGPSRDNWWVKTALSEGLTLRRPSQLSCLPVSVPEQFVMKTVTAL